MQKTSLYIVYYGWLMGCISIAYFAGLMLHLPLALVIGLVLALAFLIYKQTNTIITSSNDNNISVSYALLFMGISMIGQKVVMLSDKYGTWDAWAMWNMHAKYLANPEYWTSLFQNKDFAHTDYPLQLPANIAFYSRIVGIEHLQTVSYCFHLLITVLIPVLIFTETKHRNIIFSAIGLYWLSTNVNHLTISSYQLADSLVGFFTLLAIIAADHIETDKRYAAITTSMLGLCMFTKNEGVLISLLFVAFYFRTLFKKGNIKYTVAGIALPALALLIFKIVYAPHNDIVSAQGADTFSKLTEWNRYDLVLTSFRKHINEYYYAIACMFALHFFLRLLGRKAPDKRMLFVFTVLCAYMVVYVLTPKDLEWHVNTSLNRLVHQMIPATIYTLIMVYSNTFSFRFRSAFAQNQ
ncbi:MAG TPA: hypothetical protein VK167_01955 [Flavipsychrobacter sp.]|nr:hypothetical protein [Flavipsychrobacter sp.]